MASRALRYSLAKARSGIARQKMSIRRLMSCCSVSEPQSGRKPLPAEQARRLLDPASTAMLASATVFGRKPSLADRMRFWRVTRFDIQYPSSRQSPGRSPKRSWPSDPVYERFEGAEIRKPPRRFDPRFGSARVRIVPDRGAMIEHFPDIITGGPSPPARTRRMGGAGADRRRRARAPITHIRGRESGKFRDDVPDTLVPRP